MAKESLRAVVGGRAWCPLGASRAAAAILAATVDVISNAIIPGVI